MSRLAFPRPYAVETGYHLPFCVSNDALFATHGFMRRKFDGNDSIGSLQQIESQKNDAIAGKGSISAGECLQSIDLRIRFRNRMIQGQRSIGIWWRWIFILDLHYWQPS